MIGRQEVVDDSRALAARAAEWLLARALESSGRFRICLSGGSTPAALYEHLVTPEIREHFPWERCVWFWGDERFVERDDPASNYGMAWRALLCKVPSAPGAVFPIPVIGTPFSSATTYERTLRQEYGSDELAADRPLFDVTLLGLGSDGHTASLLPGQPVLEERRRWVAPVPLGRAEPRITLTYPPLESSRNTIFLVTGGDKAGILRQVLAGGSTVPAARLRPQGEVLWLVDRAAAAKLEPTRAVDRERPA